MTQAVHDLLAGHMRGAGSGFSIGAFGGIAEFTRDPDEPLDIDQPDRLRIATARGGLALSSPEDVRPVAYEILSARPGSWQHGVIFCRKNAESAGRRVLTELGPDTDPIRPADEGGILFDMGLGAANIDFCVRTGDPDLLAGLRAAAGRSLLAPDDPTMDAIITASPHRVAISALGRLEVYQAIGQHRTPPGPHTHVLPKLLRQNRTHSANIPVPAGEQPVLSLYPPSPIYDHDGNRTPFNPEHHEAFQALLGTWGPTEHVAEKTRVIAAISAGEQPENYRPADSRTARAALRIALRQLAQTTEKTDIIELWAAHFDRSDQVASAA